MKNQNTVPECWMCQTTHGLRKLHDGCGQISPEYVCVNCFTPADDGPCFDDLEEVGDQVAINMDGSYTLSGKFRGRPFVTYGDSLAEVEYHRDYLQKEIDERQRRELNERKIAIFPRRRMGFAGTTPFDDLPPSAA